MIAKILITLATASSLVLLDYLGMMKGSVGGAFVVMFVMIIAALVIGMYEAWSMRRGVLGWLLSILIAIVGCMLGGLVSTTAIEATLAALRFEGRPGALFGFVSVIITLSGAWLTLWLAGRFRT